MFKLSNKAKMLRNVGGLALAMVASTAIAATPITVWSDTPRLPIFEAYSQAHPDIDLTVLTVSPDELVTKLQLAMRANADMPDAIFMSSLPHIAQLSTRRSNYLMDLSSAVSQDVQDAFYVNANSPCQLDGKLLCLRNDIAHLIMWYDKPLVEELGISIPTTWEEYEQVGADLAAMDNGYIMGSGVQPTLVMGTLLAGGCELAVPVAGQENTIKIDLTTEACMRPARMIDNMLANGSLSTFGSFEPGYVAQAHEGKLVMNLGPTWFGEFVMKPNYELAEGRLAAALPPKWSDQDAPSTWSWGGGTYGGWKDTAHPDEVVELLIWVSTEETHLEDAVTMPAHKPASINWGARVNADAYYGSNDVFDVMLEAAPFSNPAYVSLRIDTREAYAKTVNSQLANGEKLVDLLAGFQEELVNIAKVAGYNIVE